MKPITLVATDLDGTLLNSRKNVTPRNRQAIKELKKHGILFGIASGRPVESGVLLSQDWDLDDSISFLIGMNGGVIYDTRTGEKKEWYLMDGEDILDIIHSYDDMDDLIFQVLVGNVRHTSKSTPETQKHAKLFGEIEVQEDLDEWLKGKKINKLIIYHKPERQAAIAQRAREIENGKFAHCSTADNLYEFMDPHINKGFGIDRIAEHFGVDKENIVAFGDANNDLEMLKHVEWGVAMANATDEAKAAAKIVSEYTNDEDALSHFIMEKILPNSQGYLLYEHLKPKKKKETKQ